MHRPSVRAPSKGWGQAQVHLEDSRHLNDVLRPRERVAGDETFKSKMAFEANKDDSARGAPRHLLHLPGRAQARRLEPCQFGSNEENTTYAPSSLPRPAFPKAGEMMPRSES